MKNNRILNLVVVFALASVAVVRHKWVSGFSNNADAAALRFYSGAIELPRNNGNEAAGAKRWG